MSVDHLQINVSDAIYDNFSWLFEILNGPHNDTVDALTDFNNALNAVSGLTKKGARISSSDTSGTDNMQWEAQDPVYGGQSYLSSSNATTLRNDVITQLATIASLESYKDISIRSYRNDLQQSLGYAYQISESDGLEIFIFGILYNSSSYVEPSDVNTLLSDVNSALDTISGLEFAGIVVSTWKASTNGIFIGVDDASYNGEKYLTIVNATTLRNAVIAAIEMISGVDHTHMEVEVRIAKKDNTPST